MKVNPVTGANPVNFYKKKEKERQKASKNYADYLHFIGGNDDEESNVTEGYSSPLDFTDRVLEPYGSDPYTADKVYDNLSDDDSNVIEVPEDINHVDLEA